MYKNNGGQLFMANTDNNEIIQNDEDKKEKV